MSWKEKISAALVKTAYADRDAREAGRALKTVAGKMAAEIERLQTLCAKRGAERDDEIAQSKPIAMILHCPSCSARHVDRGEFATRPHHTHACQVCGTLLSLSRRPADESSGENGVRWWKCETTLRGSQCWCDGSCFDSPMTLTEFATAIAAGLAHAAGAEAPYLTPGASVEPPEEYPFR